MMRILILGAGYAGLRVALELDRLLAGREDLLQITLVDRHLYHQHIALLHLLAVEAAPQSEVALPLDTLLQRRNVRFHQGEVTRIEPGQRQVVLSDGLALPYDRLVVALGGTTSYAGIAGAAEHTWPLRSYDEALRLCEHIDSRFREAVLTQNADERRRLLSFAVVGGNFTGCQLAGELAQRARSLCRSYGLACRDVRIALVERSHILLKKFGPWANTEAQRVLTRRGISLHLNTSVERIEPGILHLQERRYIRAGTIVWAAGVRAPRLLADSGLTTDELGRIPVDRYLRGTGPEQAYVFAIGDCARIPDPRGGTVPADASYAMRQGAHLAHSLLAEARGEPPRMYEPLHLGLIVSLGPGEAVGDPLGLPSTGLPAALLKQGIEKWYLTTLW